MKQITTVWNYLFNRNQANGQNRAVTASAAPVSPSEIEGSEFFIPMPSYPAIKAVLESKKSERKLAALRIAAQLVKDYQKAIETGASDGINVTLDNPTPNDCLLQDEVKSILKARGWQHSINSNQFSLSLYPSNFSMRGTYSSEDLSSIVDSGSMRELIETRVKAPHKRKALALAKFFVDEYTSFIQSHEGQNAATVKMEKALDFSLFEEVDQILTRRGWSIYGSGGGSYQIYASEFRGEHVRRRCV